MTQERPRPRTWICRFCMTPQEGELHPPPALCLCGVVRCPCGTWLKGPKPAFCYGCTALRPDAEPRFVAADGTASIYAENEWCRDNVSPRGAPIHALGFGAESVTVIRYGEKGCDDVRVLTDEEAAIARGMGKEGWS